MSQNSGDEKGCLYAGIASKYSKLLDYRDFQKCVLCEGNGESKECYASIVVNSDKKESILESKLKEIYEK